MDGSYERNISLRMIPNKVSFIQYRWGLQEINSRVYNSRFSEDGNRLLCTSQQSIYVIDTSDTKNWQLVNEVDGRDVYWTITDIDISPCQQFIIYCTLSPILNLINVRDIESDNIYRAQIGENIHRTFDSTGGREGYGVYSAKFSGSGNEIVLGCSDQGIRVYDVVQQKATFNVARAHSDDINSICFADRENSTVIFSGSDDSSVKVWDRRILQANSRAQGVLIGHREGITHVSSKGDGIHLISNGKDQCMKLWDIRKMQDEQFFARHRKDYPTTGYDYRWADYPLDDYVRDKRLKNDVSILTLRGHRVQETLIKCYFSPIRTTGQRYLYTGSQDGCVYIYDSVTGSTVEILNPVESQEMVQFARSSTIRDLAWHPVVPMIATASFDGTVSCFYY